MRRTFAGLLLGVAFICLSVAAGGWMLQRTAFDPNHTADSASVILGEPAIKNELVNRITDATWQQLPGQTRASVLAQVTAVANNSGAGAALMGEILHDAHAHLIGEQDAPAQITGAQLVQATRNAAAANVPTVTLAVPRVGILNTARLVLHWLVPISAIVAVALLVLGVLAHPERTEFFRTLGFGMILFAVLVGLLGYVLPRLVVPLLSKSIWAKVPPRLADDSLPMIIGAGLLLAGGGLALLAFSGIANKRKRWGQPVSTYRFREDRRWS